MTFKMKEGTWNEDECSRCTDEGVEHEVTYVRCKDSVEEMRVCSGCGDEDGPWIAAKYCYRDD